MSFSPQLARVNSAELKSARSISAESWDRRDLWTVSDHSLQQQPGEVLPALPARWSAEACEIGSSISLGKPTWESNRETLARPLSITPVTDAEWRAVVALLEA